MLDRLPEELYLLVLDFVGLPNPLIICPGRLTNTVAKPEKPRAALFGLENAEGAHDPQTLRNSRHLLPIGETS